MSDSECTGCENDDAVKTQEAQNQNAKAALASHISMCAALWIRVPRSRRSLVLAGVISGGVNEQASVALVLILPRGGVPELSETRRACAGTRPHPENRGGYPTPLGRRVLCWGSGLRTVYQCIILTDCC